MEDYFAFQGADKADDDRDGFGDVTERGNGDKSSIGNKVKEEEDDDLWNFDWKQTRRKKAEIEMIFLRKKVFLGGKGLVCVF